MLKGGFVNIAHKFFRVFGLTKMRILLAATIVGFNLETIRSFLVREAGEAEAAEKPRTRKKRRKGTGATSSRYPAGDWSRSAAGLIGTA